LLELEPPELPPLDDPPLDDPPLDDPPELPPLDPPELPPVDDPPESFFGADSVLVSVFAVLEPLEEALLPPLSPEDFLFPDDE